MTLNGTHKAAAGWSLGIIAGILTILSLLGLLPWATRAELVEYKGVQAKEISAVKQDVNHRLDSIERKLDAVLAPRGRP